MVKMNASGTVGSVTGTPFVASGTSYELLRFEQSAWFTYRIITYGKASTAWPPTTCETVSGIEIVEGEAWDRSNIYNYNASAPPGVYEQQIYSFSATDAATFGLGGSGIVFADQVAVHTRVKKTGDAAGYESTNLAQVVHPIYSSRVIDGLDGGVAASNTISQIISTFLTGGMVNGHYSATTGLPNWRDDLVI